MTLGLVTRKEGMTRVFTDDGFSLAVTVLSAKDNVITQIKTDETDGYFAVQVTTGEKKVKSLTQAEHGHFKAAQVEPGRGLWEFRLTASELGDMKVGDALSPTIFSQGQKVDAMGISKGKGFAGVVKRHNFRTQDKTHGNSLSHRAPGSIGQNQSPGRVFKGKKMAGQMGAKRCTVQNLEVVGVNEEQGYILVKGAIPGFSGADIVIKPAVKSKKA